MTDELRQRAFDFLDEVVNVAKDQGYQAAKAEFDERARLMQLEFDTRIANERAEYYNKGYADCEKSQTEASVTYPPINMEDGEEFSNDRVMSVVAFSYSRKFPTNWGTIILPVSLNYSDWSSRFEIAEITGVEVGKNITPKRSILGAGSQTLPNHPYLIRSKKVTTKQTITKKNCTLYPSTPGELEFSVGGKKYTFKGVYKPLTAEELKGKYYSSGGVFVEAVKGCNPMRVILEIS